MCVLARGPGPRPADSLGYWNQVLMPLAFKAQEIAVGVFLEAEGTGGGVKCQGTILMAVPTYAPPFGVFA